MVTNDTTAFYHPRAGTMATWEGQMYKLDQDGVWTPVRADPPPPGDADMILNDFSIWMAQGIPLGGIWKIKTPFYRRIKRDDLEYNFRNLFYTNITTESMRRYGGIIYLPKKWGMGIIESQLEEIFRFTPVRIVHCRQKIYGYRVAYGNS